MLVYKLIPAQALASNSSLNRIFSIATNALRGVFC